jgi:serine/threonine protein kinase
MNANPTDEGKAAMKTQPVADTIKLPSPSGEVGRDCELFEAAIRAGQPVQIETFLTVVEPPVRSTLLQELLRIEVGYRRGKGEAIDREEYRRRFADFGDTVDRIFDDSVPDTILQGSLDTVVTATSRFSRLRYHDAGGIGEIFKAEDQALKREVALKFIQPRHGSDPTCLGLFLTEAEITSRLDHPGVVPVHGIGESFDGRPFYAMRFVEGARFKEEIERYHREGCKRLDLHRLLGHLVSVCNTAAYAHNRGIVHRDIKPENIMIGRFRETLLLDWGLAIPVKRDKRAQESGEKTMVVSGTDSGSKSSVTGAGTIGYMSPEQLPSSTSPIGPASDVYSLGGTLYRLLTNKSAFHPMSEGNVFDQIRCGQFLPPRQVKSDVPPALEAICLKALATEPADRYAGALDLAGDLQAWLADEPVSVYREPKVERFSRWGRRHRNVLIYAAAAAVALIFASLSSALYQRNAKLVERDARETSMRMAARFAAANLATEIDLRWRILAEHAADPDLQQSLLEMARPDADSATQGKLQNWVGRIRASEPTASDSWVVTDAQGTIVAIDPYKADVINKNYASRDYFHGQGRQLNDEEAKTAKPIRAVHRSTVYRSSSDGSLRVAFSVPIWRDNNRQAEPNGVLAMTLATGKFDSLNTDFDSNQTVALVDLRDDLIETTPHKGLVLHHPELQAAQLKRLEQEIDAPLRIDEQRVEQLLQLNRNWLRLRSVAGARNSISLEGSKVDDYRDPVTGEVTTTIFEPVLVTSRASQSRDTGWIVVIQKRAASK